MNTWQYIITLLIIFLTSFNFFYNLKIYMWVDKLFKIKISEIDWLIRLTQQ